MVGVVLEVGYETLPIRVLEIEYVILVLIVLLDSNRLYSVLFPNIVSALPVLLFLLFPLLERLALFPALSLQAFLVLHPRMLRLVILLLVLEGGGGGLESAATVFVLARALERLIVDDFSVVPFLGASRPGPVGLPRRTLLLLVLALILDYNVRLLGVLPRLKHMPEVLVRSWPSQRYESAQAVRISKVAAGVPEVHVVVFDHDLVLRTDPVLWGLSIYYHSLVLSRCRLL